MEALCLLLILCYCGYPKRVRKLEKKVKQLQRKQEGGSKMSKVIAGLVGKKCVIKSGEILLTGESKVTGCVLETDDEWLKVSCTDKKGKTKIIIMKIDEIQGIEVVEE